MSEDQLQMEASRRVVMIISSKDQSVSQVPRKEQLKPHTKSTFLLSPRSIHSNAHQAMDSPRTLFLLNLSVQPCLRTSSKLRRRFITIQSRRSCHSGFTQTCLTINMRHRLDNPAIGLHSVNYHHSMLLPRNIPSVSKTSSCLKSLRGISPDNQ